MYYKKAGESYKIFYKIDDNTELEYWVSKQSTISSKFELIFDQVNLMLSQNKELKELYDNFVIALNKEPTISTVEIHLPRIFEIVDDMGSKLGFHDYDYVPPTRKSNIKLHITELEYALIMKASLRSKFICAQVTVLRELNINIVQYIYSKVMKEMIISGTVLKLERLIDSTVTYVSSNGLDHMSQLWVVFSAGKGIDPHNIALKERNSVFYKGLPTISPGRDPIKWLISIVRTYVKYLMKDKVTTVNIAVNNPIETTPATNIKQYNILENFIYQTVISSRKLLTLIVEMPFTKGLVSEYVFPITQIISLPFISIVFNLNNIQIGRLSNLVLLNLFTYKFLRDNIKNDSQLFELLVCKAIILPKDPETNNAKSVFIKRKLPRLISQILKNLNFENSSTYTTKQLQQVFRDSLKTLLKYDYINYEDKIIKLNYEKIVEEYIMYIYNLSTHGYDQEIQNAKDYIMHDDTEEYLEDDE